jgi:hypothetical protein
MIARLKGGLARFTATSKGVFWDLVWIQDIFSPQEK